MKFLLIGSALSLLVLTAGPARAGWDDDLRHLHWQCEHGDHEACHLVHLHRACHDCDREACERLRFLP